MRNARSAAIKTAIYLQITFIALMLSAANGQSQEGKASSTDYRTAERNKARTLVRNSRRAVVQILDGAIPVGTGFIISSDGYVVTAAHVAVTVAQKSDGDKPIYSVSPNLVAIVQNNSRSFPLVAAEEGGANKPFGFDSDVVLLKMKGVTSLTNLPCLEMESKSEIEPGDLALAIGFPNYLSAVGGSAEQTSQVVLFGAISSKGKIQGPMRDGAQTLPVEGFTFGMPVSRGFSGGPLLDYETGKVVGVVNLKYGGISESLNKVSKFIQEHGANSVSLNGVPTNEVLKQLIDVLDAHLSAGSGAAVSVEPILGFWRNTLKRQ